MNKIEKFKKCTPKMKEIKTNNKNLIAISGKIKSGKDTVASIIQYLTTPEGSNEFTLEDYLHNPSSYLFAGNDFVIKKFANKIKDIVCLLIGCTREQLENREFKNKTMEDLYKEGYITKDFYESLPDSP